MILCKSRKSAERTLENVRPYIEGKLFLKVNREKTKVSHISKGKYLGYIFYRYKGKCKLRAHPKSVAKMKAKLKELTSRSNGWGNEYRAMKLTQFIQGWVNYVGIAGMKSVLRDMDEWKVHELANCCKGIWRASVMRNSVLTNKTIASLGFMTMTDYYLKNL